MDDTLHCNYLRCRKALRPEGRAVSTSCSHIFCLDCATTLLQPKRTCPVCGTALQSADDAMVTSLNPSASYKASILAGLSPQTIMEICMRAISFYHYQTTQEAAFQQILLSKAQEATQSLEKELDQLEITAKTELTHLDSKVHALQKELDKEKRKNRDLQESYRSVSLDFEKVRSQLEHAKRNAAQEPSSAFPIVTPAPTVDFRSHTGRRREPRISPQEHDAAVATSVPQPFFNNNDDRDNLFASSSKGAALQKSPPQYSASQGSRPLAFRQLSELQRPHSALPLFTPQGVSPVRAMPMPPASGRDAVSRMQQGTRRTSNVKHGSRGSNECEDVDAGQHRGSRERDNGFDLQQPIFRTGTTRRASTSSGSASHQRQHQQSHRDGAMGPPPSIFQAQAHAGRERTHRPSNSMFATPSTHAGHSNNGYAQPFL